MDVVSFSEAKLSPPKPSKNGRYVYREAPVLFRCGDFPDKKFSVTGAELPAIVGSLPKNGVSLDVEHRPSIFDGKLGRLCRVKTNPDGATFSGGFMLPKWLDAILGPEDRKVSVSFDRNTKKIIGCALTTNPRISDAAMFAAFSDDEQQYGALQSPEQSEIPGEAPGSKPTEEEKTEHGKELASSLCEILQRARDDIDPTIFADDYIKWLDDMIAKCKEMEGGEEEEEEEPEPEPADMSATRKRIAAEAAKVASNAVEFATDVITKGHALPHEREAIINLYIGAAEDDKVSFSKGTVGSRLDQVKKAYYAKKPHRLTEEQLRTQQTDLREIPASFNTEPASGITPERRAALLRMTDLGKKRYEELASKK